MAGRTRDKPRRGLKLNSPEKWNVRRIVELETNLEEDWNSWPLSVDSNSTDVELETNLEEDWNYAYLLGYIVNMLVELETNLEEDWNSSWVVALLGGR